MQHFRRGKARTPKAYGLIIGVYWATVWPLGMVLLNRAHPFSVPWLARGFLVGLPLAFANGVVAYRRRTVQDGNRVPERLVWPLATVPLAMMVALGGDSLLRGSILAAIVCTVAGLFFMLVAARA